MTSGTSLIGRGIALTATDEQGNTSEISPCRTYTETPTLDAKDDGYEAEAAVELVVASSEGLLANDDYNLDGPLSVKACDSGDLPAGVTVEVAQDGGFRFLADATVAGLVAFPCTIATDTGLEDDATVTIDVIPASLRVFRDDFEASQACAYRDLL